jgi:pimeloyl-ACP methyl ester carboxylesterase
VSTRSSDGALPRLVAERIRVGPFDVHVRRAAGEDGARPAGAGDGSPVLLLHGVGVSGRYLVPLARRLARGHPVAVPDLPGFGRTSARGRVLGLDALASVVLAVTAACSRRPVTLVANSFGCQVAVEVAVRRPDLVSRVVLIGPTMDAAARTWLAQSRRLLADAPHEPWRYAAVLVPDYLRAGPRRFLRTVGHALRHPVERRVESCRAPLLVLRGEHDPIAPQRWAEELAARAPDGRTVVVADAGHVVHYSRPDLVAAVVERFIERRPGTAADWRGPPGPVVGAGPRATPRAGPDVRP